VLYAGEDHVAALVGSCLTLLVRSEPTSSVLQEAPRWVDALLQIYPHKGGVLVVAQANATPPSEISRKRINQAYLEYGRGVVAGAMVIEGNGFVAASLRSVVSLILLTSRYNYPLKTFSRVGEGARYLSSKLPPESSITAPVIASGVEELRVAYESEMGHFTASSVRANA
jgi:hypothetical protein